MNTTTARSSYRPPKATVVVVGEVSSKVVERLSHILRLHGPKGLRVVVTSSDFAKNLEALREFLLANYAFTVELYFVKPGDVSRYLSDRSSVVSVLLANLERAIEIPEELRNLVEAL